MGHAGAELRAVLDCGGCEEDYDPDIMAKKLKRLHKEGIHIVAIAGCVKPNCPNWNRIIRDLSEEGLELLLKDAL